jgi:hypothetical protein
MPVERLALVRLLQTREIVDLFSAAEWDRTIKFVDLID